MCSSVHSKNWLGCWIDNRYSRSYWSSQLLTLRVRYCAQMIRFWFVLRRIILRPKKSPLYLKKQPHGERKVKYKKVGSCWPNMTSRWVFINWSKNQCAQEILEVLKAIIISSRNGQKSSQQNYACMKRCERHSNVEIHRHCWKGQFWKWPRVGLDETNTVCGTVHFLSLISRVKWVKAQFLVPLWFPSTSLSVVWITRV